MKSARLCGYCLKSFWRLPPPSNGQCGAHFIEGGALFEGILNHLGKRVNTQKRSFSRRGFPVNNAPGLFILGGDNSPNGDGAEKEAGDEKEGDLAVKIDVDRKTRNKNIF